MHSDPVLAVGRREGVEKQAVCQGRIAMLQVQTAIRLNNIARGSRPDPAVSKWQDRSLDKHGGRGYSDVEVLDLPAIVDAVIAQGVDRPARGRVPHHERISREGIDHHVGRQT